MYENHYRVQDDPFRLTPDNNAAYEHRNYLSGKAFLQHIIADTEKSVVVISGVAGVGKSTLMKGIMQQQKSSNFRCCLLQSSQINAHGFLHSIANVLDLDSNNDDEVTIQQLDEYLAQRSAQDQCSVLVIDDAHELSVIAFKKLGQLARIILDNQYLAKIFLVGNEQLQHLLQAEHTDASHNSVITGWNLDGLTEDEIKPYVLHRLESAGGAGLLRIDDNAWDTIYRFSDGIPRRINRICSKLLIDGLFENRLVFTQADVEEAVTHLDKEGLLELNSNFASQHGLVGTTRSHLKPGEQRSINAFLSGFVDAASDTGKVEDVEGTSLNIKIAANDLSADTPDDLTVPASMREAGILPEQPVIESDKNGSHIELEEEPGINKNRVFLVLALILIASIIAYSGFVKKPVDDAGIDTMPQQATMDKAEADANRSILPQQPITDQSRASGQSVGNIADEDVSASGAASPVVADGISTRHDEATAVQAESKRETDESVADQQIAVDQIKSVDHSASQAMDAVAPAADTDQMSNQASSAEPAGISGPTGARDQVEAISPRSTSGDQQVQLSKEVAGSADATGSAIQDQKPAQSVMQKQELSGFTREQLKSMLLAGFWYRNGSPALLLPSELNQCTDNGPDIFCLSKGRATPSDSGPLIQHRHTGAMIEGFATNGTFNVLYRSTKAGTNSAEQQQGPSTNLLKGLAAIQEQQMSCRFANTSVIHCIQEGVRISYMRRFKTE